MAPKASKADEQEDLFSFGDVEEEIEEYEAEPEDLDEEASAHSRRAPRAAQRACEAYTFEPSVGAGEHRVDPFRYDHVIVAFSGGKDSLAMVLLLLEMGVPKDQIELWHHDIDGREGSALMDWPCTRDYCRKVADALGLKLYFSWKVGVFEGEMLSDLAPTAAYRYEVPGGRVVQSRRPDAGALASARREYVAEHGEGDPKEKGEEAKVAAKRAKLGYRMVFPQKSPNLAVRWCSAYGKIMVMDAAIRQPRFTGVRTLILTGERAEESPKRATYSVFEPHRADLRNGRPNKRRVIDVWRPVHAWKSGEVWALLEKYRINPHPAYRLSWGRLSCAACIFGSKDQWASLRAVNPRQFGRIDAYERQFGKTIDRKRTVLQMADAGTPFPGMKEADIRAALSETFDEPVFVDPWVLPAGAHGDACGPT